MRKDRILWGVLVFCLLLAFLSPLLPSFDKKGKTTVEVKTELFSKQSFGSYKIKVSEGKTETEKTLIVKYNNWIEFSEAIFQKRKDGKAITKNEDRDFNIVTNDLIYFLSINDFNVSNSLKEDISMNMKKLGSKFDEFNNEPIPTSTGKTEQEETIDISSSLFSGNVENNDEDEQCRQRDEDYLKVCRKIEKEYKKHPERFIDVSLFAAGDSSYRYYETKKGIEYNFASNSYGVHSLLEESVFMLLNEQRFVKQK